MNNVYGVLLTEEQFTGNHDESRDGVRLLLEQLRYMGAVTKKEGGQQFIVEQNQSVTEGAHRQNTDIQRLASFGIKGTRVIRRLGSSAWYIHSNTGKDKYFSLT